MRINKLHSSVTLTNLIAAAFAPFGSLDHIDAERFLSLLQQWCGGDIQASGEIVALVWAARCDQPSRIEFGVGALTIITPTSGTRITMTTSGIHIDFGDQGSRTRATQILAGGHFDAYAEGRGLTRGEVAAVVAEAA